MKLTKCIGLCTSGKCSIIFFFLLRNIKQAYFITQKIIEIELLVFFKTDFQVNQNSKKLKIYFTMEQMNFSDINKREVVQIYPNCLQKFWENEILEQTLKKRQLSKELRCKLLIFFTICYNFLTNFKNFKRLCGIFWGEWVAFNPQTLVKTID